ncbi:dextranase, partial [Paenibacillus sp. TAF58]
SYTISAWVKETLYGNKPTTVRMELSDDGSKTIFKNISPAKGYQQIQANVTVTNGSLDIGFYVDSPGLTSLQIDQVSIVKMD